MIKLRNIPTYILAIIFIIIYIALLIVLKIKFDLQINILDSITIVIGWVLALLLAIFHLNKTRLDNKESQEEELKKKLEIDAFQEINKASNNFSSELTHISSHLRWLKGKLELHKKNPGFFKFENNEVELELIKFKPELYKQSANFIITIEANEITVIKFDNYRKYIQYEFDNAMRELDNFSNYILSININELIKNKSKEFFEKCDYISELFDELNSHIFDYRIELMNNFLSDIFKTAVPERQPKDNKYKLLREIATSENLRKMEEEYLKNFNIH